MKKDPRLVAAQLRRPSGTSAAATAAQMNRANEATNLAALDALKIQDTDHVLEIGPGNGKFAGHVLGRGSGVRYAGIDWSDDMVAAAETLNSQYVQSGQAVFRTGSSEDLPFGDNQFEKALAVHTIYFWDNPEIHLSEIRRVLVSKGRFCLAFGEKSFMKMLPFTEHGFQLYDERDARELLVAVGFKVLRCDTHVERGESNTGKIVEKLINIVLCERP